MMYSHSIPKIPSILKWIESNRIKVWLLPWVSFPEIDGSLCNGGMYILSLPLFYLLLFPRKYSTAPGVCIIHRQEERTRMPDRYDLALLPASGKILLPPWPGSSACSSISSLSFSVHYLCIGLRFSLRSKSQNTRGRHSNHPLHAIIEYRTTALASPSSLNY